MNYYDILEVVPHASPEVIKNAYRALAKKYHPEPFNRVQKAACNIFLEEWSETALKASEFDVLVKYLDNPEKATDWYEKLCQFVRLLDAV